MTPATDPPVGRHEEKGFSEPGMMLRLALLIDNSRAGHAAQRRLARMLGLGRCQKGAAERTGDSPALADHTKTES